MLGSDRNERRFPFLISEVICELEKNLAEHDEIHAEALENYRKQAVERLREMLEAAVNGDDIDQMVGLTVPVSHRKSFTHAIKMLKSLQKTGKTEIEMTASEYNKFVLNEWEWIDVFNRSNSVYTATGKMLNA